MSKCKSYFHGGIGACNALRDPLRGVILTDVGTTITPGNAAILGTSSTTGWMSILAPVIATSTIEKGVILDFKRGTENTTTAAEMTTSNVGMIEETSEQQPRMTGYGNMSYSEYQNFFRANGHSFDIPLIAKNGNLLMSATTGGNYKGFRASIFVKKGAIPAIGADLQKECFFDIVFDDTEEFENIVEVETDFTFTQLKDLCPIGLDVVVTTPYEGTGGTTTIKVTSRNSDAPFAGVATNANIQILESYNNAATAVSAVAQTNAAIGSYVLTCTASLIAPVWARITAESATKRTYVSKPFRLL